MPLFCPCGHLLLRSLSALSRPYLLSLFLCPLFHSLSLSFYFTISTILSCPPLISDTLCVSLAPSEINAYILLLSLASILLSVLRLLRAISLPVWLYCCCYLLSSSSSVAYPLRLPILFGCLSSSVAYPLFFLPY